MTLVRTLRKGAAAAASSYKLILLMWLVTLVMILCISIPLKSFLVLPAVQLFAYEMAVYLGKDVDQPRNLAKSVTVE